MVSIPMKYSTIVRVIIVAKLRIRWIKTIVRVNVHANSRRTPYGVCSNGTVEQCNSATLGRYECQVAEYNGNDRDTSDTSTIPGHCDGWTMVRHNRPKFKARQLTNSDKTWQSVNEIGAVESTDEQDQVNETRKVLLNTNTISVRDLIRVSSMSERSILFGIGKEMQENGMGLEWD